MYIQRQLSMSALGRTLPLGLFHDRGQLTTQRRRWRFCVNAVISGEVIACYNVEHSETEQAVVCPHFMALLGVRNVSVWKVIVTGDLRYSFVAEKDACQVVHDTHYIISDINHTKL